MSAAQKKGALTDHELYRALVLSHAREPHNFGPLPSATHCAEGINALCGDKLSVYLEVDEGLIKQAGFEGTGCAISLASASLLTESVRGLRTREAEELRTRFLEMLESPELEPVDDHDVLKDLRALAGVRQFPSRVKCATLAWQALAAAMKDDAEALSRTVSTE